MTERARLVKRSWQRRAALGALLLASATLFVLELPIRELLHQRNELAQSTSALETLDAQNRTLQASIASLQQRSVVAAIAHADYGLVLPGERSYVVLPGSHPGAGSADTLGARPISSTDLVSDDPSSFASTTPKSTQSSTAATSSLLGRTVSKLEFWRWAF